jgi:GAF domain-containing protein
MLKERTLTINKDELFRILITEVTEVLKTNLNSATKLKAICKLLKNKVPYYNWVGFYAVDKKRADELVLVSFEGEPTEHVRIPFGKGICGQAASLQRIYVVQDVSKEANYLSCSSKVKSEIVIPILKNDMIVGELDIDSHVASPFTSHDKNYLTIIAKMASELL